mmetsp:Transcript_14826/g.39379  ORF Transcript_14826/g.39379 Transcript_14826/m.39379 type:complete len:223 (-) Transcript_14826:657-1325(-)
MMSSTRMIISAASAAEQSCDILLLNDSMMPSSAMSAVPPTLNDRPVVCSPRACAARRLPTISCESKPALSARMHGICINALAKASMATLSLPSTFFISSMMWVAMAISMAPPPWTTRVSVMVWNRTASASWRERSASSRMWLDAPRSTIVHASPSWQPENLITLSSPIMISSILLQNPSLVSSGLSKVEAMSAPSTAAMRSVPSKSECSMAITPASLKSWSG